MQPDPDPNDHDLLASSMVNYSCNLDILADAVNE